MRAGLGVDTALLLWRVRVQAEGSQRPTWSHVALEPHIGPTVGHRLLPPHLLPLLPRSVFSLHSEQHSKSCLLLTFLQRQSAPLSLRRQPVW